MSAFKYLLVLGLCLPLQVLGQVELRDDRGVALAFEAHPRRIVSLLPSLTESVCALGGCERLVGVDRFSNSPPQVQSLPKLGGLDDAQIERIAALKPDVVLAAPSSRVIDRLESLGFKVLVLESKTHADVKRTLHLLGQLIGAEAQADAALAGMEAALVQAASRVPLSVRGQRVYFEVDATPHAAGAASFIGETLTRLGLGNIAASEQGPFPRLNPELVVQARPDIVMAAQSSLNEMIKRPGWQSLQALQRGKSCGFDVAQYELLVRPGPRLGEGALILAGCLADLKEFR